MVDRGVAPDVQRKGRLAHLGRAARMKRSPGCSPPVISSSFRIPVDQTRELTAAIHQHVDVIDRVVHLDRDARKLVFALAVESPKIRLSASSSSVSAARRAS